MIAILTEVSKDPKSCTEGKIASSTNSAGKTRYLGVED
jgi:hypothetical protein